MTLRPLQLACVVGVGALAIGCASKHADPVATTTATAPAPTFVEIGPSEEAIMVRVADLVDDATTSRRYLVLEGDRAGTTTERRTESTTDLGASLKEVEPERRIQYFSFSPEGDGLLVGVHALTDQAISLFDPPLKISPPALEPGAILESGASMKVVDPVNNSSVRERGKGRRKLTHQGSVRVRTPLGELTAAKLEVVFNANLQLAKAEKRSTLYVVPGRGVVAERWEEKVQILGALTRRTGQLLVLVEEPSSTPSSQ